jgi:mono/diheme cytochrome c family protein
MGNDLDAIALAAALLLVLAATAAAESTSDPGRAMYLRYCGACHGPQGNGVADSFMSPKPADLTRLAERNAGAFPFQKIMAYIDGTQDVRAHGDPVMPVWGEVFRAEAGWDMGRQVEVRGKLMLITDYIRSMQAQ